MSREILPARTPAPSIQKWHSTFPSYDHLLLTPSIPRCCHFTTMIWRIISSCHAYCTVALRMVKHARQWLHSSLDLTFKTPWFCSSWKVSISVIHHFMYQAFTSLQVLYSFDLCGNVNMICPLWNLVILNIVKHVIITLTDLTLALQVLPSSISRTSVMLKMLSGVLMIRLLVIASADSLLSGQGYFFFHFLPSTFPDIFIFFFFCFPLYIGALVY